MLQYFSKTLGSTLQIAEKLLKENYGFFSRFLGVSFLQYIVWEAFIRSHIISSAYIENSCFGW